MNSNKLFETTVFTSGNTEKFCVLCGYGIKHTEEDHTGMLNFSPDAEFLDGLKKGDLVPTAYGYATFIGWHYQTPQTEHFIPYGFTALPRTVNEAIIEYSVDWVRYQEIVLLSDYWRVHIDKKLFNTFTLVEQHYIQHRTFGQSASQILEKYMKPDDTNYLETLEEEIEAELELDIHRSTLLDWVGSK